MVRLCEVLSVCILCAGLVSSRMPSAIKAEPDFFSKFPADDPEGRSFPLHPSPRCCIAADCLLKENPRLTSSAVVTAIRSPEYITLLRELQCSVHKTNPTVPLIVLSVVNELPATMIDEIQSFAGYREVPNIEYESIHKPIFRKNWFRLNAWNLTEYTSLILIDVDTVVLSDLTHILDLPTDFAWSYLNAPFYNWNKAGFIMIRPCKAVFDHMLHILDADESKRFPHRLAEQSFLHWYFGYTGIRLPMEYNANSNQLSSIGRTAGGVKPIVLHFADYKPMDVKQGDPEWRFMCHRYEKYHKHPSPLFT